MTTIGRLVRLAGLPVARVAPTAALGALTVLFGVGLMTAAGYLISRAAEHPPILALTTTIVAVRFFGLGRPLVRYLERLASHDLALRSLGPIRSRVYERIEPLAPAELQGFRRGDLLARMVADVDALQGLSLRVLLPPLVAVGAGAVCVGMTLALLPVAALVLAAGLLLGGVAVPVVAALLGRRAGRRQAQARGELTADLVELLQGAPELMVYGREGETMARIAAADDNLTRLGRRDALATGVADALLVLVTGVTTAAVLAVAASAHDTGALDRVLVATLALLALASFEGVSPLPGAARELPGTLASGRRVLELTDRRPIVRDPEVPLPAPGRTAAVALEGITTRYAPDEPAVLEGLDLRIAPGEHVALVGPSGSGKTTVVNLLLRFLDPVHGRVTLGGRDLREYRQEDVRRSFALAGQDAHLFDSTIRENLRLARRTHPTPTSSRSCGAHGSATGSQGSPPGSTPWWAKRGSSSPVGSASVSRLPARCLRTRRC